MWSVMFQPNLLGSLPEIFPWPPAALLPAGPRPPQRACQAQRRRPYKRGAEASASSGCPPGPGFVPAAVPSGVTWEAGPGTARVTRALESYPSYYRSGTRPRQGKRAEYCQAGIQFLDF